MKRTIMFGIILASISMVSCVTAVPYTESQPLVEKINKLENIRNTLDSIPYVGDLIGLISMMIGSLFLIPTYILVFIGLLFVSMPMPMKIGGAVFTLIGFAVGIISLFFISLGLIFSPEMRKPLPIMITFILPAIISILLISSAFS